MYFNIEETVAIAKYVLSDIEELPMPDVFSALNDGIRVIIDAYRLNAEGVTEIKTLIAAVDKKLKASNISDELLEEYGFDETERFRIEGYLAAGKQTKRLNVYFDELENTRMEEWKNSLENSGITYSSEKDKKMMSELNKKMISQAENAMLRRFEVPIGFKKSKVVLQKNADKEDMLAKSTPRETSSVTASRGSYPKMIVMDASPNDAKLLEGCLLLDEAEKKEMLDFIEKAKKKKQIERLAAYTSAEDIDQDVTSKVSEDVLPALETITYDDMMCEKMEHLVTPSSSVAAPHDFEADAEARRRIEYRRQHAQVVERSEAKKRVEAKTVRPLLCQNNAVTMKKRVAEKDLQNAKKMPKIECFSTFTPRRDSEYEKVGLPANETDDDEASST